VSQGCHKGVTRMLKGFKGATRKRLTKVRRFHTVYGRKGEGLVRLSSWECVFMPMTANI
jgi:hypothetical protein